MKLFAILALCALASASSMPAPGCWTETKKCRYVAVSDGYECKDYYGEKYARCHPRMKYRKKCEKAVTEPSPMPEKPAAYVEWEQAQSELVSYDPNYGPHVDGYPPSGASDYYASKKLPTAPHGVDAEPVPPPVTSASSPAYTAPPQPAYTADPPQTSPATPAPAYTAPLQPKYTAPPQTSAGTPAPMYTAPPATY